MTLNSSQSGVKRLYNMIRDRGDWVISRQRVWGVPLPIFYAEDGTAIMDEETINHVADLFGKYGSNVWFERDARTSYQMAIPTNIHQTVPSLRKPILWMFGSTLVHHTKVS